MVGGIALAASQISPGMAPTLRGLTLSVARSSTLMGRSGTFFTLQYTVVKDSTAPIRK
ncbi:MAG: hypothetical protein RL227_1423 [Pseudomonadota bacterium]|jgi:hypothetical protein